MDWALEPVAAAGGPLYATDAIGRGVSGVDAARAPYDFARLMDRGLNELNASVGVAEASIRDLAAGKPVELHEVMIQLERARIDVQTFVQVRNKLIESYQDLMRMQL